MTDTDKKIDKSKISPEARAVLDKPGTATWGSLQKDGSPHAAIAGFVLDGNDLVTHTKSDAYRVKNLRRDPRINVLVIDPDDPRTYVEIRGTATIREEEMKDIGPLFKAQNDKYGLPSKLSEPRPGVIVVQIRVTPHRVNYFSMTASQMGPDGGKRGGNGGPPEMEAIDESTLDGSVRKGDDGYYFEFEREFAHPKEAVFAALTEPKRLTVWEHGVDFFPELKVGATIVGHLNPRMKAMALGKVLVLDPPNQFVFRWTTNNPLLSPEFTMDFELTESDGKTTVKQTVGPFPEEAAFVALMASVHIHLDHLEAAVTLPEKDLPKAPPPISVVMRDGRMMPMAIAYESKIGKEFPDVNTDGTRWHREKAGLGAK